MGKEKEHEERVKIFKPYQVNTEIGEESKARLYFHALPAGPPGKRWLMKWLTQKTVSSLIKRRTDCTHRRR